MGAHLHHRRSLIEGDRRTMTAHTDTPNVVQRAVRRLIATRPMTWMLARTIHHIDAAVFRLSGGRATASGSSSSAPIGGRRSTRRGITTSRPTRPSPYPTAAKPGPTPRASWRARSAPPPSRGPPRSIRGMTGMRSGRGGRYRWWGWRQEKMRATWRRWRRRPMSWSGTTANF